MLEFYSMMNEQIRMMKKTTITNVSIEKLLIGAFFIIVKLLILNLFSFPACALPQKIYHPVPFLCQAPQGDWSQPWQDACEEAAVVQILRPTRGAEEILRLVAFQRKDYGGHFDLNAQQIAQLIKDYYQDDQVLVRYDVTILDIKQELAKGNIIIAPTAGRILKNPYYTPPGPLYHTVVIKGYDDRVGEFVTNDVGTKRGRNYRYKYDQLYQALADYPVKENRKAIVIISKH